MQVVFAETVLPLLDPVIDHVDVTFESLTFVIVSSVADATLELGVKAGSCHTIVFPAQPRDVVKPYPPISSYSTSTQRFLSAS